MVRIGYLVSQYPAYSHAFVGTEIAALRDMGLDVLSYSVNSPDRDLRTATDPLYVLKEGSTCLAIAQVLRSIAAEPLAHLKLIRHVAKMWNLRGGRARLAIKLAAYVAESILIRRQARVDDVHHLHVHFANNAADIAMFAALAAGYARSSRSLTWSISIHGPGDFVETKTSGLTAKLDTAQFVRTISNYALNELFSLGQSEAIRSKIRLIRMGVSDRAVSPLRRVRTAADDLRVLYVGRLVHEKNPGAVVDACIDLAQSRPGLDVKLEIVGAGPLMRHLKTRVAASPKNFKVQFAGPLSNREVLEHYEQADVLCLPSSAEGLPVVLMEALAAECVVVSSPVAAIPELVRPGETGFLVPPGDYRRLQTVLAEIVDYPAAAQALAKNGRALVQWEYNVELNTVLLFNALVAA